ncbi:hypothetical protein FF38_03149 [Lucilia cuprina]|uniref:Uncharacterized protein n=1 Tax=Lucilia cuprina TaxID=7375 RepID=A0A0L0CN49_LUCCU|nr:hypothetical protein FF38_03149 [Lucilia cuprina]
MKKILREENTDVFEFATYDPDIISKNTEEVKKNSVGSEDCSINKTDAAFEEEDATTPEYNEYASKEYMPVITQKYVVNNIETKSNSVSIKSVLLEDEINTSNPASKEIANENDDNVAEDLKLSDSVNEYRDLADENTKDDESFMRKQIRTMQIKKVILMRKLKFLSYR